MQVCVLLLMEGPDVDAVAIVPATLRDELAKAKGLDQLAEGYGQELVLCHEIAVCNTLQAIADWIRKKNDTPKGGV